MCVRGTEHQILSLMRAVRQDQWRDADWQVKAIQKSKEIAQANRLYYATLLMNGLNAGEHDYQDLTNGAVSSLDTATAMEAVGTVLGVIPGYFVGTVDFVLHSRLAQSSRASFRAWPAYRARPRRS